MSKSYYKLWSLINKNLNPDYGLDDTENVTESLHDYFTELNKPNPFIIHPRNAESKKQVENNTVEGIKLTENQRKSSLQFSEDFGGLNEAEAAQIWSYVSNDKNRKLLELQIGVSVNSFEGKIAMAAAECYYYEQECLLKSLLTLIKLRYDDMLLPWQKNIVMTFTNKLLVERLIPHLIDTFTVGLQTVTATTTKVNLRKLTFYHRCLRYLADCLFFIAYQTQYLDNEVSELEKLLQLICQIISSPRPVITELDAGISGDMKSVPANRINSMIADVQSQLMASFVVLQLTHISALNCKVRLYCRRQDHAPYYDDREGIANNSLSILTNPINRDDAQWKCPGVYAFICFSYASLGQYQLDNHLELQFPDAVDNPPSFSGPEAIQEKNIAVVQHYLVECIKSRLFSYIRLCVLPILQSSFITEIDECSASTCAVTASSISFYMDIMEECVFQRINELYMLPMHLLDYAESQVEFPFIPLSQQRYYTDELNYYREQQEQLEQELNQRRAAERQLEEELDEDYPRSGMKSKNFMSRQQKEEEMLRQSNIQPITAADISPIDCQEDIMQMFTEYFRCKPTIVCNYLMDQSICPMLARIIRSIGRDSSSLTAPALMLLASMCISHKLCTIPSASTPGVNVSAAEDMMHPFSPNTSSFAMNMSYNYGEHSPMNEEDTIVSSCNVIFQLLRNKQNTGGKLDWNFIFLALDSYINELSGVSMMKAVEKDDLKTPSKAIATPQAYTPVTPSFNMNTPSIMGTGFASVTTPSRVGRSTAAQRKKTLAIRDTDALLAIMELLTNIVASSTHLCSSGIVKASVADAIMMNQQNIEYIMTQYQPIAKLFSLLCNCSASLPLQLKGKIFSTIASFAYYAGINNLSYLQNEIWQLIEVHGVLLPSGAGVQSSHQGLKYELESVESVEGNYPVTDGFLTLIDILITYATNANKDKRDINTNEKDVADASLILSSVGYEYRVPGINMYVNYILEEVLYKSNQRYYATSNFTTNNNSAQQNYNNVAFNYEGASQRLKIVSKCLRIVTTVLQQYNINILEKLSPEQIQQEYTLQLRRQEAFEGKKPDWNMDEEDIALERQEDGKNRLVRSRKLIKELLLDFNDNVVFDYPILCYNTSGTAASTADTQPINTRGMLHTPKPMNTAVVPVTVTNVIQAPRPKSAGFLIMSYLLNYDDKLLYYIIQLLSEFNLTTMLMNPNYSNVNSASQTSIVSYIASKRVSDLMYASYASQEILLAQQQSRQVPSSVGAVFQGNAPSSFLLPVFSDVLINQHTLMLDYTCMTSCYNSKYYTDVNYWEQRIVIYCIGIIYECSLRENMYMQLLQSQPVMIRRISTLSPLNILPLSTLLTSTNVFKSSIAPLAIDGTSGTLDHLLSSSSTALALLSSYLPLASTSNSLALWCGNCSPTVPVMVVKLLQHISLSVMNNYSTSQGFSILQKLFGDNNANNSNTAYIVAANYVQSLLDTCVRELTEDMNPQLVSPALSRVNTDEVFYYHNFLAILTPPAKQYMNVISNHTGRLELIQSWHEIICPADESEVSVGEAMPISGTGAESMEEGGSKTEMYNCGLVMKLESEQLISLRHIMLNMLVNTLAASKSHTIPTITFTHYLLFGVEGVNMLYDRYVNKSHATVGNDAKYYGYLHGKNKGFGSGATPTCCLDVLMSYLNPSVSDVRQSLLLTHPVDALLCYEIIYLLYNDMIFGSYMFDLCRQSNILFTIQQLYIFIDYSIMIPPMGVININRCNDNKGGDVHHTMETTLLKQTAARNNCVAWLLKLIALEIHRYSTTGDGLMHQYAYLDNSTEIISLRKYMFYLLGLQYPSIIRKNTTLGLMSPEPVDEASHTMGEKDMHSQGALVPSGLPDKIVPLFMILQYIVHYNDVFSYQVPSILTSTGPNSTVSACIHESQVDYNVWSFDTDYVNETIGTALPQGFKVMDIERFMYHYDRYINERQPVASATPTSGSLRAKRDQIISSVISWNLYNLMLASYTHISMAYRVIVDNMIYHCKDTLLGRRVESLNTLSFHKQSSSTGAREAELESLLPELMENLVIPTASYNMLANIPLSTCPMTDYDGGRVGSSVIEMCISEPIVQALYSMMHILHYAATTIPSTIGTTSPVAITNGIKDDYHMYYGNSNALVSIDIDPPTTDNYITLAHYKELTYAIIQLILKCTSSSCTISYRVSLYHALLSLVQYATNTGMMTPNVAGEEVQSMLLEYQDIFIQLITPRLTVLIELLCRDICISNANMTCGVMTHTPILMRIIIINTFTAIVGALLGQGKDKAEGSHTDTVIFLHAMKYVLSKQYISQLFVVLHEELKRQLPEVATLEPTAIQISLIQSQELFNSVLSICNKVAMIPEGMQYLLSTPTNTGSMEDGIEKKCLIIHFIDNYMYYVMTLMKKSTETVKEIDYYLHNIWSNIVNTFITLLSTLNSSSSSSSSAVSNDNAMVIMIVEGCCMLLRKYHLFITTIFKSTYTILAGAATTGSKRSMGHIKASSSPEIGNVLSTSDYVRLCNQLIQLLILIVTHLPTVSALVQQVSPNVATLNISTPTTPTRSGMAADNSKLLYKETSLFLIQWFDELTIDIFQLMKWVTSKPDESQAHSMQSISSILYSNTPSERNVPSIYPMLKHMSIQEKKAILACFREAISYIRILSEYALNELQQASTEGAAIGMNPFASSLYQIVMDILQTSIDMNVMCHIYIHLSEHLVKQQVSVHGSDELVDIAVLEQLALLLHNTYHIYRQSSTSIGADATVLHNWDLSLLVACIQVTDTVISNGAVTEKYHINITNYLPYILMRHCMEYIHHYTPSLLQALKQDSTVAMNTPAATNKRNVMSM